MFNVSFYSLLPALSIIVLVIHTNLTSSRNAFWTQWKEWKERIAFSDLLEDSPHCGILIRFRLWHEKNDMATNLHQIYTRWSSPKRKFLEKNNLYILSPQFSSFLISNLVILFYIRCSNIKYSLVIWLFEQKISNLYVPLLTWFLLCLHTVYTL